MSMPDPVYGQDHKSLSTRLIRAAFAAGLGLSLLLMSASALLYLVHPVTYSWEEVEVALLPALIAGEPTAWMVLGLLLLMLTPAFGIVAAALGYALEKKWRLLGLALVVITILAAGALLSGV